MNDTPLPRRLNRTRRPDFSIPSLLVFFFDLSLSKHRPWRLTRNVLPVSTQVKDLDNKVSSSGVSGRTASRTRLGAHLTSGKGDPPGREKSRLFPFTWRYRPVPAGSPAPHKKPDRPPKKPTRWEERTGGACAARMGQPFTRLRATRSVPCGPHPR